MREAIGDNVWKGNHKKGNILLPFLHGKCLVEIYI